MKIRNRIPFVFRLYIQLKDSQSKSFGEDHTPLVYRCQDWQCDLFWPMMWWSVTQKLTDNYNII